MRKAFEPKLPAGKRREIFSLNDGERSILRSKITVRREESDRESESVLMYVVVLRKRECLYSGNG